ncbi:MAG: hypothetical protein A4E53_01702 [Pelotomaculum sp. PtaB.Bin104]|nr:MAG: hypothetical protein A4E53_01702 [Pelotomaculum sp. PtaB.Bin104]
MTINSRQKGNSFERNIATVFREVGWPKAKRHLEFQTEEADLGVDLDNTEPFGVQCKAYKKYFSMDKVYAALKKVKRGKPLLITKTNLKEPLCTMYLRDFLSIVDTPGDSTP